MERWMEVWREYPELSEKDLLVSRCVIPVDAVDGTKSRVSCVQRCSGVWRWCGRLHPIPSNHRNLLL